jgi:hypothetical protein
MSILIKMSVILSFLFVSTNSIAQKNKASKLIQISDHRWVQDCSNYEYQLKQNVGFVGGKSAIEKLLLQNFKKEALAQNGESPDCYLTIRLFPNGKTQLRETDALKSKYREKVISITKQIFLGNNKWTYPVFISKPRKYIDIQVVVLLYSDHIEYDASFLRMDPCEHTIFCGNIRL